MNNGKAHTYYRIAKAITYIKDHFKEQPTLDQLAAEVNLSSFHFQRMFTEWVGTSPKKFLQYVSLQFAKTKLANNQTLFDTAFDTGLSGTSRLHDLFVTIEGMSPAEYKNGGKTLTIHYSFEETPFGNIIIASTTKGICHLAFFDEDQKQAFQELQSEYPNATFNELQDDYQRIALQIFDTDITNVQQIKIHLKGTDFQLKVWEALLKVPTAEVTSYNTIAELIHKPSSSRAVGNAIGKNPIAYIIPCHRVIKSNGTLGGYRWNTTRKTAILGWEETQKQLTYDQ